MKRSRWTYEAVKAEMTPKQIRDWRNCDRASLPERLKEEAQIWDPSPLTELLRDAADEIEDLRAAGRSKKGKL